MEYQVIVVGAGYFGCSIAYHLSKAGIRTLLLDKGEVGCGASGANFGNVQVQDSNMGLSLTLTLDGFARMQSMERELQADIGFQRYPSLIGAEKESHLPELRQLYEEKKASGLDIHWLEGERLRAVEPNLAPEAVVAATYYEQGRVYPFHYMYALIKQARFHGLVVRQNTTVCQLFLEKGTCCGVVLQNGQTLRAEHVVVAAGAGVRQLCRSAGLHVPVQSVKAEGLVTEAIQPFMRTYYSSAAFFAEAHSQQQAATSLCIGQSHYGNMLVAETSKPHKWVAPERQDATSLAHLQNTRQLLLRFFPALRDIQVLRSWVTASPTPIAVSRYWGVAQVPGLIVAAGFKSAVILSGVAGEIVADLVQEGKCRYNLTPFMNQVTPLA